MRRVTEKPWFGPKKYVGWGWRISTWQGRVVTLIALVLLVASLRLLDGTARYLAAGFVVVMYLGVIVLTGDPPGGPKRSA